MRILLINPNTTDAVTQRMAAAARRVASPGTEIRAVTALFGARIIGSRVEAAFSAAAVIERLAREAAGCDAAIIGASVDPGLAAAREMLDIPVVAITEAALHTACLLGGRFGAVVMGPGSDAVLREMADAYGLGSRLGVVHRLALTPHDLLADPAAAVQAIAAATADMVARESVDCVVLIGAVMAGVADQVQSAVPVPVVEGVSSAVVLAEGLVRLGLPPARGGSFAAPRAGRVADLLASMAGLPGNGDGGGAGG